MENLTKDVKKLTVAVTGMHCPNCEHLIERRVSKIPGVVGMLASEHKRNAEIFYLGELDFDSVRRTLEKRVMELRYPRRVLARRIARAITSRSPPSLRFSSASRCSCSTLVSFRRASAFPSIRDMALHF